MEMQWKRPPTVQERAVMLCPKARRADPEVAWKEPVTT